jgi:hypothetical protein
MALHDVTLTADCERILAVGTLLQSGDGFAPSQSRAEKRIIVYDMVDKQVEKWVDRHHFSM